MHNNWFAVSRMVFDHYVVGAGQAVKPADPRRGAYSRMEAWLWLIANAAYEPQKVMNRGREVLINPGQLMAAHDYLAQAWNWTPDTVRYFVKRLELTLMISRWCDKQKTARNTNQIQVVTVCNYDRYQVTFQSDPQAISQVFDQAFSQARAKQAPSEHHESNTKQITQEPSPNGEGAFALNSDDDATPFDALKCFQAYNELAQRVGLPVAAKLNPTRRKAILARLKEHDGHPSWELLLANIQRSAFLQGKNDRKWRPTGLDWFLKAANFTKVIEGTYGNGAHADEPEESRVERYARILEEIDQQEQAANP